MSVEIRRESPADAKSIREIHRAAFGGEDEARLVDELRAGGYALVSLVAVREGRVVGHILFSPLAIESKSQTWDAVALAPLAVLPEFQGQQIGKLLTNQGLDVCRVAGHRIAIVLGHPHFYQPFGFSAALARQLDSPFAGDAFMALELQPRAMEGVTGNVRYAPPFGIFS